MTCGITEGYGTILSTSPDNVTYTPRAGVTKISGPNMDGKSLDASDLDSADGFMEFCPGMVDGGEIMAELNFKKTEVTAWYALVRTEFYAKITFTTGSTWVAQVFITKLGKETPHDDKITMSVTLKISGKPTWTE
jgi:hypothetical protein